MIFEEEYTYDVLNRRIRVLTDSNGSTSGGISDRWSAYEGDNVWADFDENGYMVTRYLNGREMDQRFARMDVGSGDIAFYLTDNINSVRQIVDEAGIELYSASYKAFGEIESQSGSGDRFKYTGRELDATGQYYYRARYYGAGVGRFASEDPIGFAAGDPNLYRYVANNSISSSDPSGLAGPAIFIIVIVVWLAGDMSRPADVLFDAPAAVVGGAAINKVCGCILQPIAQKGWQIIRGGGPRVVPRIGGGVGPHISPTPEPIPVHPSTPWGRPGVPEPSIVPVRPPQVIGGRPFSGHAVEQMQRRGLVPCVAENAIANGTRASGNTPGTSVFTDAINGISVVVDDATGRIITIW